MKSKDLFTSANRWHATRPGYALTLWSWPDHDAGQIARRVGTKDFPYGVMRQTTVGRLHGLGCTLEKTGKAGHYSLHLQSEPDENTWEALRAVFDEPTPNPVALKKAGK